MSALGTRSRPNGQEPRACMLDCLQPWINKIGRPECRTAKNRQFLRNHRKDRPLKCSLPTTGRCPAAARHPAPRAAWQTGRLAVPWLLGHQSRIDGHHRAASLGSVASFCSRGKHDVRFSHTARPGGFASCGGGRRGLSTRRAIAAGEPAGFTNAVAPMATSTRSLAATTDTSLSHRRRTGNDRAECEAGNGYHDDHREQGSKNFQHDLSL